MAAAPRFRKRGKVKEFITARGDTYIVMKFPDGSVMVLRKIKDTGRKGAAAQYVPLGKSQKEVLERLGARGGTTYQMGVDLLE
jgi:hypothetical protein